MIMNIYQGEFIPGMPGWFRQLINITHHINRLEGEIL